MADVNKPKDEGEPALDWEQHVAPPDVKLPADPGGARTKGYSADPQAETDVPKDGPIPLADAPRKPGAIKVPRDPKGLPPTGRDEPAGEVPDGRPVRSGD